jgi:MoaA/NifB/PqqE/SkfB family radical SAM enzyme
VTSEDSRYIKDLQLNSPILSNGQRMVHRDIFAADYDHCPAGVEFMGLSADGELLPCNFLQFSLGNVRNHRVREMREALLASKWFQGQVPRCLCGEDNEFIRTCIVPFIDQPKPLNAFDVFNLPRRADR